MDRPCVVLVGAGGYGAGYMMELLAKDAGADLVGICDISSDLKERYPIIAEKGIPVYQNLEAFYAGHAADLAIIVAPVHYHTTMALTCFAHGTNVLCEKPLCLREEEAETMAAASRASGKFLAVGYQLNYRRDVLAFKQDILDGRFGPPKRLRIYHACRRGRNYYARNNWAGRISVNGLKVLDSPFNNACAHNFQMMSFLIGDSLSACCELDRMEGELYRGNPDVENYDIAALRFYTSKGAELLYYTAHPLQTRDLGPYGLFEFEKASVRMSPGPVFDVRMNDGTCFDYSGVEPGGGLQKLYDALDSVRNGTAPVCGIEADLAHIRAVRMAQDLPIREVREDLRSRVQEDGDSFVHIEGLEDILAGSAEAWALPGEAGYRLD